MHQLCCLSNAVAGVRPSALLQAGLLTRRAATASYMHPRFRALKGATWPWPRLSLQNGMASARLWPAGRRIAPIPRSIGLRIRCARAQTGAGFFTGARDCPNREHGLFSDPQRRLAYRRVATVPVRRALQVRSALPARPTIPQLVRPRLGSRSHPSPMHRARALYARQAFLPAHSLRGNAERPPRSPGAQYPKRICVTLPECGASLRTVKRAP